MVAQWRMMCVLVAVGILVLSTPAFAVPQFSPTELAELLSSINRVGVEKDFVRDRITMLEMQKTELFDKLDEINEIIANMTEKSGRQDGGLDSLRTSIKGLLHTLGDTEGELAAEKSIAESFQTALESADASVAELESHNQLQNGQTEQLQCDLGQAKDKVALLLDRKKSEADADMTDIKDATNDFKKLVGRKKCFCVKKTVSIHGTTDMPIDFPEAAELEGQVPDLTCVLCSLESQLFISGLKYNHHYGFLDAKERTGVSVDCKYEPSTSKIRLSLVDQSRGKKNKFTEADLFVSVCTYSPLGH